ncbi:MAG: hypothetical protein JWL66_93 [Sphingomonadales bacterium]|nr:hypothetical protein [Sphingomonadales bacterium]
MANLPVMMEGLRASVPVKINGKDTSFWLDSGAFFSIMSKAKSVELALKLESAPQGLYLVGIGGSATVQVATVKDFGIAGQQIKDVQFLVGGSDAGNGLIGRNLLAIADTEFDLANGSVRLINARNCEKAAMAYWAADKPYFTVQLNPGANPRNHLFDLTVGINGVKVRATFDSGAPMSLITRSVAEKAGIDFSGPGVIELDELGGFGRRLKKGWSVPVASFSIGDEQILRTRLTVIDGPMTASAEVPDMLIGADFMLAHHIYVARRQAKIYFTYTGGRPFLTPDRAPGVSPSAPVALPSGTSLVVAMASNEPKVAEDFARRGNARLMQRDLAGSVADLTEAIRLSPDTAAYYRYRSIAYHQHGQMALMRIDIEKSLKLDPNNGDSLQERALLRLEEGDKDGAFADAEAAALVTPPASLHAVSLAVIFERLDRPTRAIPIFNAVIAAHPDDSRLGELLNGRCWQRGLADVELDKALDDCNRAIKRDGAKASFLDSRGLIYVRKTDFAAAITNYDAALKINPKIAWSLYLRGLARIKLGQAESGEADQAAAMLLKPGIADEAARIGLGAP